MNTLSSIVYVLKHVKHNGYLYNFDEHMIHFSNKIVSYNTIFAYGRFTYGTSYFRQKYFSKLSQSGLKILPQYTSSSASRNDTIICKISLGKQCTHDVNGCKHCECLK